MKTYFCFSTRHIIYVRFPWRCKIPFLFQDALLSPPPNVVQHLRQHFFLQKLYQLHCDLSANIRWCGDRINIIIHFMFHGNLEECSEKCLFRLGLDSGWAAAATERGGGEAKPSPSFPQCWGKKYIPGLTSDPGLVLIYFSKLSSPPRDRSVHGNPPWIQGKWFMRQNFCCHKRVSYGRRLHIFDKYWEWRLNPALSSI